MAQRRIVGERGRTLLRGARETQGTLKSMVKQYLSRKVIGDGPCRFTTKKELIQEMTRGMKKVTGDYTHDEAMGRGKAKRASVLRAVYRRSLTEKGPKKKRNGRKEEIRRRRAISIISAAILTATQQKAWLESDDGIQKHRERRTRIHFGVINPTGKEGEDARE